MKRTVAGARRKASKLLTNFPERIKNYEFEFADDRQMFESYKKGMAKALPLFREVWDLEEASVEHMEDIIDLLEETRRFWESDQGVFMFERDRDLERVNAIMGKITACVDRQTEIREKTLKSVTDKIGGLKNMIPE